jgi:hypothetical protein
MRPDRPCMPGQTGQGDLPARAGAGRDLAVQEGERMRGRQPCDRSGQCQIAGPRLARRAGTPLRDQAGPGRIPVDAPLVQTARAARLTW